MSVSPSLFEHLKAILALPFMVIIVIPTSILFLAGPNSFLSLAWIESFWTGLIGLVLLIPGLIGFVKSVDLLVKIGKGTLAPWNPTQKIVIHGLYRHVRNPMLIGVNIILLAEALIFRSGNLLLWNLLFLSSNHVYFVFKEEPDLYRRFGAAYRVYCENVPRWIPRLNAWQAENEG